jgi:hypothetical protein
MRQFTYQNLTVNVFFKKRNQIEKALNLPKDRNEKKDSKRETIEYFEKLYINKLANLEETDIYDLPKLKQKDI